MSMKKILNLCILLIAAAIPAAEKIDLTRFFAIPSPEELPLKMEIISEKEDNGVKTLEFYLDGAPFNNEPTKIYAFYSYPVKPGKYPGVLQLHGSGLNILKPDSSIFYARNGFACISIDWQPPTEKRKGRQSVFKSEGRMVAFEGDFLPIDPANDYLRNGVMFSRRSLDFLRSRPEVDSANLFVSGMSAGAWQSLLLAGLEPEIKAFAIKYGSISGDNWGYTGGVFGRLYRVKEKGYKEKWLEYFDAANMIPRYKANMLILSGTDDIFFAMPKVLETWRRISSPKSLVMRPNDNHRLVGNEEIPLAYYRNVLQQTSPWPSVTISDCKLQDNKIYFTVKPDSKENIKQISIIYKHGPRGFFKYAKDWQSAEAVKQGDQWLAEIPAPPKDSQLVAYAYLEDSLERFVSSDTVEIPDYPQWHGKKEYQTLDDGNYILNPSFEQGANDFRLINQAAVKEGTGILPVKDSTIMPLRLPFKPGAAFEFKVRAKSKENGGSLAVSFRWTDRDKKYKSNSMSFSLTPDYAQYSLSGIIPEDAVDGLLILKAGNDIEIHLDDLYYNFK